MRQYIPFSSAIDIGCGIGNMLRACQDSGVSVIRGVDGSWVKSEFLVIPAECFTQYDLSRPNLKYAIPEKHFDLTISSEVAEHIEADKADIFFDNLTSFSDVILFSAAIPLQGGTHHVNEQFPSYWSRKFSARGFVPVDCIRPKIWDNDTVRLDYRQNLILYIRNSILDKYPALKAEAARPVMDIVHPAYFLSSNSFKVICKSIIPSFIRAVRKRLFSAGKETA